MYIGLKKAIGMALTDAEVDAGELGVEIYNNRRKIKTIPKSFYKEQK